jgi:hypothetical protein
MLHAVIKLKPPTEQCGDEMRIRDKIGTNRIKLSMPHCDGDAEHKIRHLNEFVERMKSHELEMDHKAE